MPRPEAKEQTSTGSILRRKNPARSSALTCRVYEKVGTDAVANLAAFARSPSGKTRIAGGPGPTLSGKNTEAQTNLPP